MIYITKEEIMAKKRYNYLIEDYSSIDKEYMDTILNQKESPEDILGYVDYTIFFRLNIAGGYYVVEKDDMDKRDMVVM